MARVDQNIEFIRPPRRARRDLSVRAGPLLCEKASYQSEAVGRMDELTGTFAAQGRKRPI